MSVVLYVLGAIAVMVGAATIGFGVPIKEFGIGNTLILSGTVVFCTGLIVVGLAAVVAHLRRLGEAGPMRAMPREARPIESFERAGAVPPPAPLPFPPRRKSAPDGQDGRVDLGLQPPVMMPNIASEPRPAMDHPTPMLPNPDEGMTDPAPEPPSLPAWMKPAAEPSSPPPFAGAAPPPFADVPPPAPPRVDLPARAPLPPPPPLPAADTALDDAPEPARENATATLFDNMWPQPAKAAPGPIAVEPPPAAPEPVVIAPAPPPPEPNAAAEAAAEPRGVAVLKSGEVDGMAYTLYVDGSIEAELPQGTLYFASINELREYLEKNG